MKHLALVILTAGALASCDEVPDRVFFEQPTERQLTGGNQLVGVWVGTEEITTDEDISYNINFPGTNGFSFPVVVLLEANGRFTLTTSNYPTSYDNDASRSCTGIFSHSNSTIQFFSQTTCRALPMTKYTLGRELSGGITFEARTNTSTLSYTYTSVHVIFHLRQQ